MASFRDFQAYSVAKPAVNEYIQIIVLLVVGLAILALLQIRKRRQ